jgi:hypothetical protein
LDKAGDRPYLWLSILLGVFANPDPIALKLANYRQPDTPLLNFLFFNVMLKVVNPVKKWQSAAEKPDIPMMLVFRPDQISDTKALIIEHLNLLSETSSIPQHTIWRIVSVWRAWSLTFGFDAFLENLLSQIIWKTVNMTVPEGVRNLFQSVAYLMPLVGRDDGMDTETCLRVAMTLVDKGVKAMTSLIGLAEFCLIAICTCPEKWDKNFGWFLDDCVLALEEDPELKKSRSIFALGVVKSGLYQRMLRTKVVNKAGGALSRISDWQTLIDFFIVKHCVERELNR